MRSSLDAIQELRVGEQARDAVLDAALEVLPLAADFIELHQRVDAEDRSPPAAANARVASCENAGAQGASLAASVGRQVKIARRLGVSPGPVGLNGPLITTFSKSSRR